MEGFDPYAVLGIDRKATADEIHAAYRKAAKVAHPDMESGSAEAFHAVERAYALLTDEARRWRYDFAGDTDVTDEDKEAVSVIQRLAAKAVQGIIDGHPNVNVIDTVKRAINDTFPQIRKVIAGQQRELKIMDRLLGEIDSLIVERMLTARVASLNRQIEHNERQILIGERALEIIRNDRHNMIEALTGPTVFYTTAPWPPTSTSSGF